ncbi:MAG: 3'(2'),5'-bisphosphate nucleotidase CysQ [Microthrixaceae bacterium]
MSSSDLGIADDHALAARLATEAGRLLLDIRAELAAAGADAAELKVEGDRRANAWLMEQLRAERPHDPILSEEERERPEAAAARLGSARAWIVDPLDGTREFSEPPRSDWAVHVALSVDGVATLGAVALPALGVTLATGPGAPTLPPRADGPPRIIVSRSRPPAEALQICDRLGGVLVEMGSAGAKAMAVVRGEADIYPHSGGQYEWDSCAPVAVALAAGLWCSRLDGSPLRYNNADPYLPDLLICRPEMAAAALEAADWSND